MAQLVNCLWGPEFNPQHPSKKRSKTQKPGCSNLSPQGLRSRGWERRILGGCWSASLVKYWAPGYSETTAPHTPTWTKEDTAHQPVSIWTVQPCMLISAPTNIHTHTILNNNKKMSDKDVQSCYRHFTLKKQRVKVFWNKKLYRGTTVIHRTNHYNRKDKLF